MFRKRYPYAVKCRQGTLNAVGGGDDLVLVDDAAATDMGPKVPQGYLPWELIWY